MEETQQQPVETAAPEAFPIDEAMQSMIADCTAQIARAEATLKGALILFARQHGLQGDWKISPNGKELIKLNQ